MAIRLFRNEVDMANGIRKRGDKEGCKLDLTDTPAALGDVGYVAESQKTSANDTTASNEVAEITMSPCPPNSIYVLDPVAFHRKTALVIGGQRNETQTRLRSLLLQHQHLAMPYPLRGYPTDMARGWQRMRMNFPNFGEVLDLLEKRYALALLRRATPISFPPLLLLGDPGVGKTAFCTALAREINLFYGDIPMAGLTEAFTISGLDIGWSTGSPGRVFEHVSAAGHANPLLLLDEIDKCGKGGTGGDPHAPLHILLERHSAQRFEDISIRMPANMSWINWIATANDPDDIPSSLLSRFRKVVVPKPTREQMRAVVRSIYAHKRASIPNGDLFARTLEEPIVTLLQDLTPRAAGLAIEEAMGATALRSKRRRRLHIAANDIAIPSSDEKKSIGFYP